MSTLHITRGLPGSGKSTWAKGVAATHENMVRFNRDDLRMAMFGVAHGLTRQQEDLVTTAQRSSVRQALRSGFDVICDDTNLYTKFVNAWHRLAGEEGADFQVHEFETDTEACIERDAGRARPVGEGVIRGMADRAIRDGKLRPWRPTYEMPDLSPYVAPRPGTKPLAVLVDIDGTLARHVSRSPYDMSKVLEDEVIEEIVTIVNALEIHGAQIVFVSGREDKALTDTIAWLADEALMREPITLYMRKTGDQRPDWVVKAEIFNESIRHNYDVLCVLDDRDSVVRMWRRLGLTCLQVAEGDF